MKYAFRVSCTCLFFPFTLSAAFANDYATMAPARNEALRKLTTGNIVAATGDLLTEVRQTTSKDDRVADQMFGHLQLVMFSVEYLMDDAQRDAFLAEQGKAKEDQVGELIDCFFEAFLPKNDEQMKVFFERLWVLAQSEDPLVAVAALFILADPYYTSELPIGIIARERLVKEFPDLEVTREAVRLPFYWYRTGITPIYDRTRVITDEKPELMMPVSEAEREYMKKDPFYLTLTRVYGEMIGGALSFENAQPLFDALDREEDWRNRYSLLRMVEPLIKSFGPGANLRKQWAPLRDPLRRISEREPVTPDVFRSWVLLCKIGRVNHDAEEVQKWSTRILEQQARPLEHPERILFEEAVKSVAAAAEELERSNMPREAAKLYERLANTYPGSAVESEYRSAAERAFAAADRADEEKRIAVPLFAD